MERGVLGGAATYQFGRWGDTFGAGELPLLERRFKLQVILALKMRTTIPKKSTGRLDESRTASQPGGVRDGEVIQTHPVTLPF